ncbi:Basic-leucine zipper transcription factor family protein isoform 2 [Hibiscus syriacus]|uniref:Basic-leucine zipper transcription factor family protein isoform 2 n=1 Tax=Hibiscus syriacus TaxID=106335 RepID=A0A6A3BIL0_HIBSY|nr:Basic-leucine zipper transcription factor family protein isoform 2 [Hibiscus syriacus]
MSDNEAESSANKSGNSASLGGMNSSEKREGIKRSAGGDIAPSSRHYRSVSMDSFMGKLNFGDESPKLPPSPGTRPGRLSPGNSIDGNSSSFSLDLGSGFWLIPNQLPVPKKEDALHFRVGAQGSDSADRSYHIVCSTNTPAGGKFRARDVIVIFPTFLFLILNFKLTQRESAGLTNQNNDEVSPLLLAEKYLFTATIMVSHASYFMLLALKETLTAEVRRLKLATRELGGDSDPPKGMVSQQLPVNHQIFQLHQQQSSQLNIPHQFQQQQPQSQQQNGNTMTKSELKQ